MILRDPSHGAPRRGSRSSGRTPAKLLFAGLVALAVAPPLGAVGFERRFERLVVADGLSDAFVTAIVQDRRGFVWIGTQEGLNRFDGSTIRIFRRSADAGTPGLASNRISALLVARDGTLWIGTQGGGLSRYDPERETFTTFRHDPADPASLAQDDIADLEQDDAGRLWIATFRGGLALLEDPGAAGPAVFRRIVHDPADPASLGDDRTREVLADRFGEIWIATMGGVERLVGDPLRGDPGFAFAHTRNRPDDPRSLPDDEVWALCRDAAGDLWVGMWGSADGWGLARARLPGDPGAVPERLEFERFGKGDGAAELPDNRVMRILQDGQGAIWIATQGGLLELPPGERERPRFRRHVYDPQWRFSLPGPSVADLWEDAAGDLWLATEGGVGRIDRSHEGIVTLRVRPGEAGLGGDVNDAWIDHEGVLWVATEAGLDRVELGASEFRATHFPGAEEDSPSPGVLPIPAPHEIVETEDGWLWMSSYDYLAALPSGGDRSVAPRFLHVAEGLSSNAVLALHEDAPGTLWVGTYRGLHRIERDASGRAVGTRTWSHDPDDPDSLSSQSVSALASSPQGTLWVGTYVGLNRLDPATGTLERFPPDASGRTGPSHEFVTSLAVDPSGALWVGTRGGGLDRLDPATGRFSPYGIEQGLPSENVFAVETDAAGRVWSTSPRGLVRLDPATGDVRVLDELDGLPESFVGNLRIARDGRLLVVTHSGLSLLRPEDLAAEERPPPVVLTGLRIRNQPVPIASGSRLERSIAYLDRLVLDHDDDLVTIEFAALSFRRPQRCRYRFRLEGLDAGWVETGAADAKATYTTLPPGSYTFRVQGANGDGEWGQDGASLAILVRPPWYLTWWARLGAALSALGAVVVVPLLRLRRARRLNVLLEARVAQRTEELTVANRKLEEAARCDFLTGLPNRRELIERAEREVVAQRRSLRPFAVAIADLDDFKSINDRYGHGAGDAVLVGLATLLRAVLREQDCVARWGGEEFIFLFPDTDRRGALTAADKVRRAVENGGFSWEGNPIPVTLTAGLVEVRPGGTLDGALSAADAALYEGKAHGKNRIVAAELPAD